MESAYDSGFKLLTHGEAAAILRIHVNTLRRWADAGLIPTLIIGPRGDRRYFEADIRSYLDSGSSNRKPSQSK
jgi:predicted site-specific integrase-resolvase